MVSKISIPKNWKAKIGRAFVELAIVSFGVFLGTMFAERRDNLAQTERQIQIYTALIQELDVFVATGELTAKRFEAYVAGWDEQYNAGSLPRPLVFSATGLDTPPRSMWDATVASDGLRLIPVKTIYSASEFYHALETMVGKYEEVVRFGNERVIPFNSPSDYPFYDQSGFLKPEYEAYTQRFKDVVRLLSFLAEQSRVVKDMMQLELDALSNS